MHTDSVGIFVYLCVNATEATMKRARSVEEDGRKVIASVGCKAEGKSTAVTP